MAIEAEWEGLQWTESPYDIFTHFIINLSLIWMKHPSF